MHSVEKFKEDVDKLDVATKFNNYMESSIPPYNPELILSDELDGSIISLYLRDGYGSVIR